MAEKEEEKYEVLEKIGMFAPSMSQALSRPMDITLPSHC